MRAFYELVDRMNAASPAERPEIERTIRELFEVEKTILALDMSGFSLTVRRDGILGYLGLIRRMQIVTLPLVERFGGELVKHEADNILALFDAPSDAVRAALAMHRALAEGGGERAIRVAIGIDRGRILFIPGSDCFGDAVNTAFKLGEDIAEPGEVLVTRAVRDGLDEATRAAVDVQDIELSISGIHILAARISAGGGTP